MRRRGIADPPGTESHQERDETAGLLHVVAVCLAKKLQGHPPQPQKGTWPRSHIRDDLQPTYYTIICMKIVVDTNIFLAVALNEPKKKRIVDTYSSYVRIGTGNSAI
ncbi:hypothetical protein JCM17961_49140 [Endothiovibrio diazotrophicus]